MTKMIPGQSIHHRYTLQQQLEQRPGRQTWLAQDADNGGTPVVLKILTLGEEARWEELKLFEREGKILQQLSHPQIPQAIDFFPLEDEKARFGLVHSYIPGFSLKELLQAGKRFSPQQVKQIARSVLRILVYLHELSPPVLHRDIKPSNLVWGMDKQLYLIDFGAVQDQAAMEGKTFTVVGTYGYTPIEQYGGRSVPASDLYGLGATLIHLLTGMAPIDLPQTHQGIQFQERVSGNPAFMNWVAKLAHPSLTQRFTSAKEALRYLESGIVRSPQGTTPVQGIRPYGSQIELRVTSEQLEAELPYLKSPVILRAAFSEGTILSIWIILLLVTFPIMIAEAAVKVEALAWAFFATIVTPFPLIGGLRLFKKYLRINYIQKIFLDRRYLKIVYRIGAIPYWRRQRALGKLQLAYSDRVSIWLQGERRRLRIAEEIGLCQDELRWLAYKMDCWRQSD